MVVLGGWLDSILEVFSNLWFYDYCLLLFSNRNLYSDMKEMKLRSVEKDKICFVSLSWTPYQEWNNLHRFWMQNYYFWIMKQVGVLLGFF